MAPEKEHPMTEDEMTKELAEQGHPEQEIVGREGVTGKEQRDAEGRLILSDEHYSNGDRQVIQVEHGQPAEEGLSAPSVEFGKLYTKTAEGEPTEKMLVREHPRTKHSFTLKGVTADGTHVDAFVEAVLENMGRSEGEQREPWSHFIAEGADAAKAFKWIKGKEGEKSRKLKGDFGSLEVNIGGRAISFPTFDQISLDFDEEGNVKKVTAHCRNWEEKV